MSVSKWPNVDGPVEPAYSNTAISDKETEDIQKSVNMEKSSLLADYCEVSSCCGVIDWHKAVKKIGKIFWALILIVSIGFTIWQTLSVLINFAAPENRFQTSVTTESGLNGRPFPDITLCNFNRINASRAAGIDQRVFELAFTAMFGFHHQSLYNKVLLDTSEESIQQKSEYFTEWKNFIDQYFKGVEPTLMQVLDEYGHECSASLISVLFAGKPMKPSDICAKAAVLYSNFGRCFTFDLSQKQQRLAGATAALQVIINPAIELYQNDTIYSNFLEEGVALSIGYHTESIITTPIAIRPGTHSYISLSMKETNYQQITHPAIFPLPCEHNPKLQYMTDDYSRSKCSNECFLKNAIQSCGCVPYGMYQDQYRHCSLNETLFCFMPHIFNISFKNRTGKASEIESCYEKCLDSCEGAVKISASVTTASFPNRKSIPALRKTLSSDFWEHVDIQNLIALDVFFPVLERTVVTVNEATPLATLIGDVGGALGLITGMCIMTLIQALYYLTILCHSKLVSQPRTTKPMPTAPQIGMIYSEKVILRRRY